MRNAPSLHRHIKKLQRTKLHEGTLLSYTVIHHPPEGFGSDAYAVGLIELTDGSKVCAQITNDGMQPAIGAKVVPHMRKIRTLNNGLHVNDIKYRVVSAVSEPSMKITSYVLALTGPSGVGKTTITRMLLSLATPYAEQVPIYTTRAPKHNEAEPYKYISKEVFQAMVDRGEIVSHTYMASGSEQRFYGYAKKDIEKIWNEGKLPIVVTDINLLRGLADAIDRRNILSFGLLPPGKSRRRMLSELLHRLRERGRDTQEQIDDRLKVAEFDLNAFADHSHLFDHMIVNDELQLCVEQIHALALPSSDNTRSYTRA